MKVKICGIREPRARDAAVAAGADFLGFVFFDKSPRNVTPADAAALARDIPAHVRKVALVVNAEDAAVTRILAEAPIDILQLQGAEPPERVAQLRARFGLPVIKAVGIAQAQDLAQADAFAAVADFLLLDAKPPKSGALPGGNGIAFDWRLIAGRDWPVPWMLAGGLTAENVADAVALTGAPGVDVSSGVETAPGVKDPAKIRAFVAAARAALPA